MGIKGPVNYWHLAADEPWGMTWCNQCKKTCRNVQVEFHQGISSDWMCVRCGKCGHGLWSAELDRKKNPLNKKCTICGKKTSWLDSASVVTTLGRKGEDYLCSLKCSRAYDKRDKENDK